MVSTFEISPERRKIIDVVDQTILSDPSAANLCLQLTHNLRELMKEVSDNDEDYSPLFEYVSALKERFWAQMHSELASVKSREEVTQLHYLASMWLTDSEYEAFKNKIIRYFFPKGDEQVPILPPKHEEGIYFSNRLIVEEMHFGKSYRFLRVVKEQTVDLLIELG